jgi:hypothetical protein
MYYKNKVRLCAGVCKTWGVAVAGTNILTTGHWYEEFEREKTCTVDGGKPINIEDVEIKRLSMEYDGVMKTLTLLCSNFLVYPKNETLFIISLVKRNLRGIQCQNVCNT